MPPAFVKGIGFDATCSLAVLDRGGKPLSVSPSGDPQRNIIVWMDHRAIAQAERITETGRSGAAPCRRHHLAGDGNAEAVVAEGASAGDVSRGRRTSSISPTISPGARREDDALAVHGDLQMDLSGPRAALEPAATSSGSGSPTCSPTTPRRSAASVAPGTALGDGLTAGGAQRSASCRARRSAPPDRRPCRRNRHVGGRGRRRAGRSARPPGLRHGHVGLHHGDTETPCFVPGVWGPYFSAMVPGLWLNEGGQSATGAAIDHLVQSHPAYAEPRGRANAAGSSRSTCWSAVRSRASDRSGRRPCSRATSMCCPISSATARRMPIPARAVIAGLDLDAGLASLERLFVAGLCGLAYGLADVVDVMREHAHPVPDDGDQRRREPQRPGAPDHGRYDGLPVGLPATPEPVLLGAACWGRSPPARSRRCAPP